MDNNEKVFFAPQLMIDKGVRDISFYKNAFGAIENRCFYNNDGTIHVAELSIGEATFILHEVGDSDYYSTPMNGNATTVILGLFVSDVDDVMNRAILAGGLEISAAKNYPYGYRQGEVKDPFGHHWLIQSQI